MIKRTILIVTVLLTSLTTFAQGPFDKFEELESVTSFIVSPRIFKMAATVGLDMEDPETKEYADMVSKVTGFKVFVTDDKKVSTDMTNTLTKYLKSSKLEELMRIKDGGQIVKFYVKEGKDENHVKEFLMFVSGLKQMTNGEGIEINGQKRNFETVVMTLTGDIDLRQVSKIANQMDLPGGEQLKKATKE